MFWLAIKRLAKLFRFGKGIITTEYLNDNPKGATDRESSDFTRPFPSEQRVLERVQPPAIALALSTTSVRCKL